MIWMKNIFDNLNELFFFSSYITAHHDYHLLNFFKEGAYASFALAVARHVESTLVAIMKVISARSQVGDFAAQL